MKKSIRVLFLTFVTCSAMGQAMLPLSVAKKDGSLVIKSGATDLLNYRYEIMYPPEGVDSAYQRSAFIHPLKTPHGQVLTRIQPKDHYHHYGIWNPRTHVLFEEDTLDFWNLKKREGTVRFVRFDTIYSGPGYAEFQSQEEHVAYPGITDQVALREKKTVRIFDVKNNSYLVDIKIELQCVTGSPFLILAYRYGGFAFRAREDWNDETSEILTSEGKTRADADATLAKWCIAQGALGDENGGLVIMSHPENHNHPEPLRLWPVDDSNKGQLYINFSPTKFEDWQLEPGETYTLRYRLLVFNGKVGKKEAQEAWTAYTMVIK